MEEAIFLSLSPDLRIDQITTTDTVLVDYGLDKIHTEKRRS